MVSPCGRGGACRPPYLTLGFMYESGTGMRENKCRAYLCYDLVDVIWDECAKDSRDKLRVI